MLKLKPECLCLIKKLGFEIPMLRNQADESIPMSGYHKARGQSVNTLVRSNIYPHESLLCKKKTDFVKNMKFLKYHTLFSYSNLNEV